MKALFISLCLLLCAATARAQDAFPLASAQIVNAPDVRGWPATAAITHITVDPSNLRVDFTKRDGPNRWLDVVPPGFTGPIEYTVWLFLNVNGQWVGSGFIQMWNGRDGVGDAPSDFAKNWYYGTRWSPLQTHGPIGSSEQIGIMVTSGNARDSGGPYGPQERSNVVLILGADTGDYSFQVPVQPPAPPPVTPPPVVVPPVIPSTPPLTLDLSAVLLRLDALQATNTEILATAKDTNAQVTALNKSFTETIAPIAEFLGKYIAPAVAAWVAAKKF